MWAITSVSAMAAALITPLDTANFASGSPRHAPARSQLLEKDTTLANPRRIKVVLKEAAFTSRALASASRCVVKDPALLAQTIAVARSRQSVPPTAAVTAGVGAVQRQITFTGCGGFYTYLFGVAAYIQQNFEWEDVSTIFASASAGAYPAFLLAAGIDVEAFHRGPNRDFLAAVYSPPRDSRAVALGKWNDAIREHFTRAVIQLAGPDAHLKVQHRHYISLTEFPSLENALVCDYASVEDLVEGFIASGFLPLYDRRGRLAATWRGQRFFDGGLSDNAPQPLGDKAASLTLSPSKWREHEDGGSLPVPFVDSDWAWCDAKYEMGKRDAAQHHAELAAFFEAKDA